MLKMQQVKINHHYIWSHYLKKWSNNNRDIFYISQKGSIACDSVKGLARETDFYRISLFNTQDIDFIKRLSSKSPQFLQDIHNKHLRTFIQLSSMSSHISSLDNIPEEISSIDQVIQQNNLENLHTFIEKESIVFAKIPSGLCVWSRR